MITRLDNTASKRNTEKHQTMASGKPEYLFFGEIPKGHTFKVIVDLLSVSIQKTVFTVTRRGLFHRNVDDLKLNRILIDVAFPREKFKSFECTKRFNFSVNLKHLKNVVKNIKKKDILTLYILIADPNKLHIYVKPAKSNKKKEDKIHAAVKKVAKKSKTTVIDHCDISFIEKYERMELPERFDDAEGGKWKVYSFPKVIDSSDFLKIKKMMASSKVLNIEMRGHNYISFYSSASGLYGSQVTIGEDSSDEEDEQDEDTGCNEGNGKNGGKNEEDVQEDEDSIDSEYDGYAEITDKPAKYEAQFNMSLVQPLMKLPTLSTHMQFYAPCIEAYPLKVKVDAGNIAVATIYVKDIRRIEMEEQISEQASV